MQNSLRETILLQVTCIFALLPSEINEHIFQFLSDFKNEMSFFCSLFSGLLFVSFIDTLLT